MNSPNVESMLAHRLRRWANIDSTLGEFIVFAGFSLRDETKCDSIVRR